jgi:hypothetical protein
MRRVAVFVSGPVRYAGLVQERLAAILRPRNPAFFFHLWKADLGNKIRRGYESDWRELPPRADTKVCVFHEPYDLAFYTPRIGAEANTHSTVNAVMGMFLGLSQLCAVFRTLPDREEFTHILRVRSDCAFTSDQLAGLLARDSDAVILSHDAGLPKEGWVSDHVLCAPADLFLKIFEIQGIADLYEAFERGQRNPEKMLKHLLDSRLPKSTRLVETIERYRHYQLVYSPPRPTDAPWVQELVEGGRMEELFLRPEKFRSVEQDEAIVADQATNWAPARDPFRNPFINWLRTLKKRVLGK